MKLTRQHLTLNGSTISYLVNDTSSPDAPAILFLHGWPLAATAFRPSLEQLANTYHVIAPDLPGLGHSDYVPSLQNYEAFAAYMRDFLQALAITDVMLVGHSTGGGIALMIAYHYPAIVRRLVLIDSAGIPLQGARAKILARTCVGFVAELWAERLNANYVPLWAASVRNALFRFRPAYKILPIPLKQDLRPILPHIHTPCLIAWGEKDRTIPLAYGEEMVNCMVQAQLVVIKDGYHEWSALRPATLETQIADWMV